MMNAKKLASLEHEFRLLTLPCRGSIFMLPTASALEFLQRCRNEGLILLGLDAFIIHQGGQTQPSLQYSTDYSRSDLPPIPDEQRYELAIELLSRPEVKDLYFECFIDTQD